MARPLLLVGQPLLAPIIPLLAASYDVIALWERPDANALARVDAVIWAGEFVLERALVDAMPRLSLIACFTVGYDGVDLTLAKARGIAVTHAGDANAQDVADHAIGLMIAHRRWIVGGDRHLRAGLWTIDAKTRTASMGSARLGIVGMGAIGVAVAERAMAMRMAVSGDFSDGLRITELPVESAGPSFQQAIIRGKFHGTMAATTPTGSRVTRPNWS